MRTITIVFISLISSFLITIHCQEFTVKKHGLKFPDGRVQKKAVIPEVNSVPEFNDLKIFAVTSPQIIGDVITTGFVDHIQFYQIENKLKGRYTNSVLGDPINNYFEAIKRLDRASVPLMEIFHNGLHLDFIEFKLVYPNAPPGSNIFYIIKLEDVEILSVGMDIITNSGIEFIEKYQFIFNEMRLTYVDGGIETTIIIYENDI